MILTEDQRYFMGILETAGFIRAGQVLPLLRINEPQKELKHAEALLRRLRYLGRLTLSPEGLVCLPELRDTPPDREMLLALDVLLALHPDRLLRVSLQPPYKLCFLVQWADGWIDYFAVMPVPLGHEGRFPDCRVRRHRRAVRRYGQRPDRKNHSWGACSERGRHSGADHQNLLQIRWGSLQRVTYQGRKTPCVPPLPQAVPMLRGRVHTRFSGGKVL